jgi:hypothetical protein
MRHTRLPSRFDAEMPAQRAVFAVMYKTEHGIGRHRSPRSKKPFKASLMVPSPPTAMISRCPSRKASRTMEAVWAGPVVTKKDMSGKIFSRASSISRQSRPVRPPAELGLKTTKASWRVL